MARARKTSVSQLQKFMRCPRNWYYSYKQKIKEPPSIHLIRGSFVHLVSETFTRDITPKSGGFNKNNYKTKIPEIFATIFETCLHAEGEFYGRPTPSPYTQLTELYAGDVEKINTAIAESRIMLDNYINKFMTTLDMMYQQTGDFSKAFKTCAPTKQEFEIDLEELRGFIDQIFEIGEYVVICDLKSSKMKIGKQANMAGYLPLGLTCMDPEYEFQLLVYLYAYWKMTGTIADYLSLNYLAYGNELSIPTKWINTEELFPQIEETISAFMRLTESDDINDYPMNCDGSVHLLPNFELENLFCSAKTAKFAGRNYCYFDKYCNECLGDCEWTDVGATGEPEGYTLDLGGTTYTCTTWIGQQKGFKKPKYLGELVKETEKAIMICIPELGENIWMPKSQITKM
ncbi:MAG: PD-(D/E)XK nuclease family protein [Methanosarcina sp.]|nr:PD-(D/E)XK nuclease family protein [Methanosarcina sp.]